MVARRGSRSDITSPGAGLPFVILEANGRIGDTWRRRWDSLRLFTPARFDGIPGLPFPAAPHAFPTKDEMADYLEGYAKRFALPVRTGVQVERLSRNGSHYLVTAGSQRYEAEHVVVAMATYQRSKVPSFAGELDPGVVQLHSSEYRNPSQLKKGPALIVGAGNSGSEIALDLTRAGHQVWMSGRDTGEIPFRISGFAARLFLARLVLRFVFHRVLTTDTPVGRKARPKLVSQGGPLIRVKARDLAAAGVERVPRTVGVRNGLPVLEDGRVLEAQNVVWCTGYHPGHLVDRPSGVRQGRRGGAKPGNRGRRARAVLRRAAFSLRHVIHDDPRRREGRGVHRRDDRCPSPREAGARTPTGARGASELGGRRPHALEGGGERSNPAAVADEWSDFDTRPGRGPRSDWSVDPSLQPVGCLQSGLDL